MLKPSVCRRPSVWRATVTIALLVAFVHSGAAWAQQEGDQPEPRPEDELENGTIIVTAQKRAESIQDVPLSISAFGGKQLTEFQNQTVEAIAVQTPGLSFSKAGGQSFIYLRGIGSDTAGWGSDASVAMSLDGIYVGRLEFGSTQFYDLERVEVLRGPQGTLYGRNATGGVINIISREPTFTPSFSGSASYGSFDRREIELAGGSGLAGAIAVRLAARYLEDDGFTKDLDPAGANTIDDQKVITLRGSAKADIGPGELGVIVDYTNYRSGNTSIFPLDNLGIASALGAVPTRFGETRNDLNSYEDWWTVGLTANLDLPVTDALGFAFIGGWRDYHQDFLHNTDGTEIDVTRTMFVKDYEQYSVEGRLTHTTDRLRAVGGLFYFNEQKEATLGLVRIAPLPSPLTFVFPSTNDSEAWAAFFDATYKIAETVSLIAGIRYSNEKKKDRTVRGVIPDILGLDSDLPLVVNGTRASNESWNAWTPRFGIQYEPDSNLLFYATASRGFKSGGVNSYDLNAAFDPEYVWAYEVGVKSDLLDRRLRLNAAVFYYDYKDLQVSTYLNGFTFITNAAEATIKGAEIEGQARVHTDFRLNFSIAYLDARYDSFLSPFGVLPNGSINLVNLAGNRLRNAPEWKLTGGFDYEAGLGRGLTLRASSIASYTSRTFFNQFNENIVSNGALTLIDARLGVGPEGGPWEVSILGKNLLDEEYFVNAVRFTSTTNPALDTLRTGNALGYPAAGRSFSIQVSTRF